VKLGRRIYLIVCGGEQLVEVPKLTGRSLRDAKFSLEQRGLDVGEVVKKFSNELPEDAVISQVIQPGSKVKRTTKIDLILSNGPELGPIRIPDLVGKKLDEAKKLIESGKLKVGKITYQTSKDVPAGQVLDQYPKKDKSATENTPVDLFISKKPVVPVEPLDEDIPSEEDQAPDNKNVPKEENNENNNNNNENPVKEKKPKEKEESGTQKDIKKDTKKKVVPKKKEDVKTDKDTKEKNSGF
jgi:serine/threonine-protein kinase